MLVDSNIWGPSRTESTLGSRSFIAFIDNFSCYTWLFLINNRFELFSIFTNFYQEIQTQFGVSIHTLHSDNSKEYSSHQFQIFVVFHGVLHQTSCAHTRQQNGLAECKNRYVIETTRTLLLYGHVPFHFWEDTILVT